MQPWKHARESFRVTHRAQMEAIGGIHCGDGRGQGLHSPMTMADGLIGAVMVMVMMMMVVVVVVMLKGFLSEHAAFRWRCHRHPRR